MDFFAQNFRLIRASDALEADVEASVRGVLEYAAAQAESGASYMCELSKAVEVALHEYDS